MLLKKELEHATGIDTSALAAIEILLHWKMDFTN